MTMTTLLLGLAAVQIAAPPPPPAAPSIPRLAVVAYAPRAVALLDAEAPAGWLPQDPADSLYRAARGQLNAGNYRRASELFESIRARHPSSGYVPASMYWQAFSLQRVGGMDPLRTARTLLRTLQSEHPNDPNSGAARELMVVVQGSLAQLGDADAARATAEVAASAAPPVPPATASAPRPPRPPRAPRPARPGRDGCEDETEAMLALNALMNMGSERAIPILRDVMARRDEGSVCLRRRAVFIVSQKRGADVTAILLQAARADPDGEVREQAVFWLSQVNAPEAVVALDSILQRATDRELQEKAIFALSQQRSPEAGAALRRFLERRDADPELRESVVFWLGQRHDPETSAYLRDLFNRTTEQNIRERILFSVAQQGRSEENARWLVQVAMDPSQPTDIRKTAIFWASQMRSFPVAELQRLYTSVQEREIKEQILFALGQRREDAAVDAMIAIVRQETDTDLRRTAIFWLGQSRNPRAAEFLLELINQ